MNQNKRSFEMFGEERPEQGCACCGSQSRAACVSHYALIAVALIFPITMCYTISSALDQSHSQLFKPSIELFSQVLNNNTIQWHLTAPIFISLICWIIIVPARTAQLAVIFKNRDVYRTECGYRCWQKTNLAASVLGWIAPIAFVIAFEVQLRKHANVHSAATLVMFLTILTYFLLHSLMTMVQGCRRATPTTPSCTKCRLITLGVYFLIVMLVAFGLIVAVGLSSGYVNKAVKIGYIPRDSMEWLSLMMIPIYFVGFVPIFWLDNSDDDDNYFCCSWFTLCCCGQSGSPTHRISDGGAGYYLRV